MRTSISTFMHGIGGYDIDMPSITDEEEEEEEEEEDDDD